MNPEIFSNTSPVTIDSTIENISSRQKCLLYLRTSLPFIFCILTFIIVISTFVIFMVKL